MIRGRSTKRSRTWGGRVLSQRRDGGGDHAGDGIMATPSVRIAGRRVVIDGEESRDGMKGVTRDDHVTFGVESSCSVRAIGGVTR